LLTSLLFCRDFSIDILAQGKLCFNSLTRSMKTNYFSFTKYPNVKYLIEESPKQWWWNHQSWHRDIKATWGLSRQYTKPSRLTYHYTRGLPFANVPEHGSFTITKPWDHVAYLARVEGLWILQHRGNTTPSNEEERIGENCDVGIMCKKLLHNGISPKKIKLYEDMKRTSWTCHFRN
jgi:hypothetical protein